MNWKFELGQRVKVTGDSAHAGLIGIVVARTELISGTKTYRVSGGSDGVGVNEFNLARENESLAEIQSGVQPYRADAPWDFQLGESVILSLSGERGVVGGRGEYDDGSKRYLVRYLKAGESFETQCEHWFAKTELAKQEFVLITTGPATFDNETWRKIIAHWESRGRNPLTDSDIEGIINLPVMSNRR